MLRLSLQCCTLDDMLSGRHAVRLLFHERVAVAAKCCEALIYLHSKVWPQDTFFGADSHSKRACQNHTVLQI